MKNTLKISLKPGEKIYVNGAVIRVERKTTLEFLNDVQFLLESHVLQVEDANTPLKQLYFIAQVLLISPSDGDVARDMFRKSLTMLLATFDRSDICTALKQIDRLMGEGQTFEALRAIRALYPLEELAMRETLVANDTHPFVDAANDQRYAGALGA